MAKAGKSTTKAAATTKKPVKKKAKVTAESPFFQARFTNQSVYWIIFGAAAIFFALWLFTLDARIRDLYDQIDANTYSSDSTLYRHEPKKTQE